MDAVNTVSAPAADSNKTTLLPSGKCATPSASGWAVSTISTRRSGASPTYSPQPAAARTPGARRRHSTSSARPPTKPASPTYEASRPEEAVGYVEQDRARRERREDRRGVALTDILLGQVHLGRGHTTAAIDVLTGARAALIEVVDPHDAARALAWLGRAHSLAGHHEQAEQAGRQAHGEFVEHGSRQWTARSLEMLGQSAAAAGRAEDAVALFTQALQQYSGLSAVDAERVRRQLEASR